MYSIIKKLFIASQLIIGYSLCSWHSTMSIVSPLSCIAEDNCLNYPVMIFLLSGTPCPRVVFILILLALRQITNENRRIPVPVAIVDIAQTSETYIFIYYPGPGGLHRRLRHIRRRTHKLSQVGSCGVCIFANFLLVGY